MRTFRLLLTLCILLSAVAANATPRSVVLSTNVTLSDDLSKVKAAGFNTIRLDVPWKEVQKDATTWDYLKFDNFINVAVNVGLDTIVILDYGNTNPGVVNGSVKPTTDPQRDAFAQYAARTVDHFQTRAHHFEVWNEWNNGTGTPAPGVSGNATDYVALLSFVINRINNLNNGYPNGRVPTTKIVIGAVSPGGMQTDGSHPQTFTQQLVDAGALAYGDIFSLHPYTLNGVMGDASKVRAEDSFSVLKTNIAQIQAQSANYPILVSEIGWATSQDKYGFPESVQGDELTNFIAYALGIQQVVGVSQFRFTDGGTNAFDLEARFGLYRSSGSPLTTSTAKPSLQSIFDLAGTWTDLNTVVDNSVPLATRYTYTTVGTNSNGTPVVSNLIYNTQAYQSAARHATISVPCTGATFTVLVVGTGYSEQHTCNDQSRVLPLTRRPILITRVTSTTGWTVQLPPN